MFRTELTIAPATGQLPRTARVLTVGSCFADSIGLRLAANKVETLANPFGTVFQPLALGRLLRAAAGEEVDWQQHLVEARGRWQSYDLHGSIGADSPAALLQIIRELVRRTGEFLRQADLVLLTLGTAWAYRLRETGELVSNCHKQLPDLFVRELLTPDEIINALAETHAYLRRINPELRFVLTVSPVRHLKDTLPLNSVSKSVLRLATHIVSELLPGVAYFPAFELLTDDLRDYRFYASDMLHPSEIAEDYIWDKFARTYFDADFGRFRKEWATVRQSLGHRPLHEGAPEHRQFLESTREKLEQLSLRSVEVGDELNQVRTRLAALPVLRQAEPAAALEDEEERIDIGERAPTSMRAEARPLETPSPEVTGERPPRLSPEEFRAQRNGRSGRPERSRRDGQNRSQRNVTAEDEQFQSSTFAEEQSEPLAGALPALSASLDTSRALPPGPSQFNNPTSEPANTDLDPATNGGETEKKKKRRSRGGAKRTARKNALRLAAGEILPESETGNLPTGETNDSDPVAEHESTGNASESAKISVIAKSEPVKRGGRRNEPGRVPRRTALFAATPEPEAANPQALVLVAAEVSTDNNSAPRVTAAVASDSPSVVADSAALSPPRDNGRRNNRDNRNTNRTAAGNAPTSSNNSAPTPTAATRSVAGSIALPTGPDKPAEAIASTLPVKAIKSNRAKRMVSAARAEKPAVDVPVVPISDAQPRSQVAAGRMTGTSASLVAPTPPSAPAKKAAAAKKPAAPQRTAVPQVAKVAKVPSAPTVVASPAKITKPKPPAKPKVAPPKAVPAKATIAKKAAPAPATTEAKMPGTVQPGPLVAAPTVAGAGSEKRKTKPVGSTSAKKPAVTKSPAEKKTPARPATTKSVISKPKTSKKPDKTA